MGAPGAQGAGDLVAHIAHLRRHPLDLVPGFPGNVVLVAQRVGDRVDGIARPFGDVLQGDVLRAVGLCHVITPFPAGDRPALPIV